MFGRRALIGAERVLHHPVLWVAVYVLLALAVLWRTPASAGDLGTSDSIEYGTSAAHWVDGKGLTVHDFGGVHPTRYPPGYPILFLAPLYALDSSDLGLGIYSVVASALAFALLLRMLCAYFLPSRQASWAASLALAVALSLWQFDWVSRQLLSDMPSLSLFFAVWVAWVLREKSPNASYLIAGVATAVALSMRLTHLAFCIPHLLGLLRMESRPLFWKRSALLLGPILLSAVLLMSYFQKVFGSPFYTGYHYWLDPHDYTLNVDRFWGSLKEMTQLFLPVHRRLGWWDWAAGPFVLFLPFLSAWACRKWQPATWSKTKGALLSLGQIALPILLFYSCYPFPPGRFIFFLQIAWLALGVIWACSLCSRFPLRALFGLFIVTVFLTQNIFVIEKSFASSYRKNLMVEANHQLPKNALLIGEYSNMAAQYFFVRDTERSFLPILSKRSGKTVGAAHQPRTTIHLDDATRHPERIEEALDAGRRVFVMAELTHWRTDDVILNQLLEKYRSQTAFILVKKAAVVELFRNVDHTTR